MKKKIEECGEFYVKVVVDLRRSNGSLYVRCPDIIVVDSDSPCYGYIESENLIPIPKKRKKADPDADPLAAYPVLHAFYPKLCIYITALHPRSSKFIKPKTARKALAMLVSNDGNKEQDVIDCLNWVFDSNHEGALFWRRQVRSIVGLRQPTRNCPQKYAAIWDRYHESHSRGNAGSTYAEAGDEGEF